MQLGFLGEFNHVVDAKNRLFIPAKFREGLGETFVIVKPVRGNCLRAYSADGWEACLAPLRSMSRKDAEKVMNYYARHAITVSPDSQGRVVITSKLLGEAEIQKDVVILGCNDYVDIWSLENYNAMVAEEDQEELLDILERNGL